MIFYQGKFGRQKLFHLACFVGIFYFSVID